MEQIFDIILICVSCAACVYCWMLSRRLKAFGDMEKGVGASIAAMNESVAGLHQKMGETNAEAGLVSAALSKQLEEAAALQQELRETGDVVTGVIDEAVADTEPALDRLLDQAQAKINEKMDAFEADFTGTSEKISRAISAALDRSKAAASEAAGPLHDEIERAGILLEQLESARAAAFKKVKAPLDERPQTYLETLKSHQDSAEPLYLDIDAEDDDASELVSDAGETIVDRAEQFRIKTAKIRGAA